MPKSLPNANYDVLLRRLRKLRESRGLRQRDLAQLLGLRQAAVSNVERGERRLDIIELHAWLQALREDFLTFARDLDSDLNQLRAAQDQLAAPQRPARRKRSSGSRHNTQQVISALADVMRAAIEA